MTTLAYYSSLAMVTSAVVYLLAFAAHGAEWAAARRVDGAEPTADPRVDALGRIGLALTTIAVALHVGGVVLRGLAAGRAPWGNMYEFVTTTLAIVGVGYVAAALSGRLRWLGLPVTGLLVIGQGLAVTVFYVAVAPLVPALHSVWFVIHIVAAAVAGAAFALGVWVL